MQRLRQFIETIPVGWAALAVLAGAVAFGWSARVLYGAQAELPERVTHLESAFAVHVRAEMLQRDSLDRQIARLEQKIEAQNRTLGSMLCLMEADRKDTPWQECVNR